MKNKLFFKNLLFPLILALLYCIYCGVLSPIYINLCSNVIYLESYLPGVLEVLLEICQLLIWVHLFSNLFYAVTKQKTSVFIAYTVTLTFARYFYTAAIALVKGATLEFADIIDAFIYFGADMLILAITLLAVSFRKRKIKKEIIRFGSLISAILLSVFKIMARIVFDIFYGVPESFSEILFMIVYYFSDILYGVVAYFLIYYVSKLLHKEKNSY